MRPITTIALALLAPSAARAQSLPPAPHVLVSTVTAPGYFTEPSIAVDPRNVQHLVAAYQDNAHAAWSRDGGRTWTIAPGVEPTDYRVSGDVSVSFDNQGAAILCFIAFDHLGTTDYWASGATRNGIFVRRSLDGGETWEAAYRIVDTWPTRPGIPWEDKPYIVADVNPKSPHAGNLYIGWTEFTLDQSVILFSRSTDHGATWSEPLRISTVAGLPRDDNGSVEGFTGAVGPDGTLYVVWGDGAHVLFTASSDGGRTFAPSRPVVATAPDYFKVTDVDRANGFPEIAIDPRGEESRRLYVTWSDYRNGDVDVFAATSSDRGGSWSPAVRVNDDSLHNGKDQFFQWLAVDPTDGAANILFYDRRADSTNRTAVVVLARSTDGGRHWANYAWTDRAFDARNEFIGDYTGIAALGGRVFGIWTEVDSTAAAAPSQRPRAHHAVIRIGVADFR